MGLLDFLFRKEEVIGGEENSRKNDKMTENINFDADGDFLFTVEDVFSILGRGTVVTGLIERGSIKVGDTIKIKDGVSGEIKISVVAGIEKFRKMLKTASAGDTVGILLRGPNWGEISKGDILFIGELE